MTDTTWLEINVADVETLDVWTTSLGRGVTRAEVEARRDARLEARRARDLAHPNAVREDGTPYYRGGCVPRLRLGACAASCMHRRLVEEFHAARFAWEERRENEDAALDGPRMEDAEYRTAYPAPTFNDWLRRHSSGSQLRGLSA